MQASPTFAVRMTGAFACFTRPEFKVERVSYEAITPSAARGILESVFWSPLIRWRIEEIELHQPIRLFEIARVELKSRATRPSAAVTAGSAAYPEYAADDDRVRRHTVALRDVDYTVRAHFELAHDTAPARAYGWVAMFRRRMNRGQHFSMPYLGCREFACDVEWAPFRKPLAIDREIGRMLHDIDHGSPARPTFFDARIENGVIRVPTQGVAS